MASPHDVPDARGLVESVREWIEREVSPNVTGRLQFHARVASNVLAMVERELAAGDEGARILGDALRALGASSDAELASSIRDGLHDGDLARVLGALEPVVRHKVEIANPAYLDS